MLRPGTTNIPSRPRRGCLACWSGRTPFLSRLGRARSTRPRPSTPTGGRRRCRPCRPRSIGRPEKSLAPKGSKTRHHHWPSSPHVRSPTPFRPGRDPIFSTGRCKCRPPADVPTRRSVRWHRRRPIPNHQPPMFGSLDRYLPRSEPAVTARGGRSCGFEQEMLDSACETVFDDVSRRAQFPNFPRTP